jgi:hypothetical protein
MAGDSLDILPFFDGETGLSEKIVYLSGKAAPRHVQNSSYLASSV